MAYRPALFLSFLLIICTSPVVHCSLLDDVVDQNIISDVTGIGLVSISGVVQCYFPPPSVNEPSLPAGMKVALMCDGKRTVINDAVTDTNGFFEITLNTLQNFLFRPNKCDACRLVVTGTSAASCGVLPERRGALLAPINCRDVVVEQLHGDEQGRKVAKYKAEPFYHDPSY